MAMSSTTLLERTGGNVLTVDLEDWYMEAPVRRWDRLDDRVEADTDLLLDLLGRHNVTATFFVLGYIAERHPNLIARVAAAGHEIGLHGMMHRPLYDMTPNAFRDDLRRCRTAVEAASGAKSMGYRAPYFSITRRSLWALQCLAEAGMAYDASIFPIWHFRYGIPGWPRQGRRLVLAEGKTLVELPTSCARVLGWNIPFSGGGYLRLLPYNLIAAGVRRINRRGLPAVVYVHPWELDPDQPHIGGPAGFALRHYLGLRSTRAKLERLLSDFRFVNAARYARAVEEKGTGTLSSGKTSLSPLCRVERPTPSSRSGPGRRGS